MCTFTFAAGTGFVSAVTLSSNEHGPAPPSITGTFSAAAAGGLAGIEDPWGVDCAELSKLIVPAATTKAVRAERISFFIKAVILSEVRRTPNEVEGPHNCRARRDCFNICDYAKHGLKKEPVTRHPWSATESSSQ